MKQHNVVILDVAGQTGYAYAESVDYNPGPPGRIKAIWVPVFPAGGKASEQRYLQSALMHELLHACNIYHHGDEDVTEVVWQKLPGTEIILETDLDGGHSRQVDVYDEDGTYLNRDRPLLNRPLPDGRLIVAIGERNGTHSGPDHCAMRYDSARAYRVPGQPTKRYRVLEEPVGLELCGSAAGSGVNNAARTPQSRYGDAQPGRGNCAGQLMVNDGGPVIVR